MTGHAGRMLSPASTKPIQIMILFAIKSSGFFCAAHLSTCYRQNQKPRMLPENLQICSLLPNLFFQVGQNENQIKNGKVFVHCAAGISRSGGIVVGRTLIEHPEWSWSEAMEYISEYRQIWPAVEIKASILDYLEEKYGKYRD